MATYEVRYTGRNHPTDVDGVAAGLRVLRDGDYFQFFLPLVSGPDLAGTSASSYPSERWWQALVRLGIMEIQSQVAEDQFQPREDPTQGHHLPIRAARIEQHLSEPGDLPELINDLLGGHPVGSFEGP